jgi:hypothetical protein
MGAKFKAWVVKFEKTKLGEQVFRFLMLTVVTAAASFFSVGTPLGLAALAGIIVGAVESAFRAVWTVTPTSTT